MKNGWLCLKQQYESKTNQNKDDTSARSAPFIKQNDTFERDSYILFTNAQYLQKKNRVHDEKVFLVIFFSLPKKFFLHVMNFFTFGTYYSSLFFLIIKISFIYIHTFSHRVLTCASVNWLHSFNCSIHWSRSFVVALSSIAVEVEEKVSSIFVDSILTAFR